MPYNTTGINRIRYISPVNTIIIIINVVAFLILEWMGDTENALFMYTHGANDWVAVFEYHEYYRLLTCTFMHFGLTHLFNNMLVLAYVGDNLERALGKIKYLVLYLVSAVGSSLVSVWFTMQSGERVISAGASGAVFAVVGALLYVVVRNRGHLEDLSTHQLILFIIFSVYHGVTSAGVDNEAHIAGLVLGALLGLLFYRGKRTDREHDDEFTAFSGF